jgi:hypothetical protein
VISDIKITNEPFDGSNKISDGRTDLYLGFDILNATDPKNLDKCHPSRTIAVVSTTQTPTGQMVAEPARAFPAVSALIAASTASRARPTTCSSTARRSPTAVRRRDGDQQLHGRRRFQAGTIRSRPNPSRPRSSNPASPST